MWPRAVTIALCINFFRNFAFRESGDEVSWLSKLRSLKPRNGAYLDWLLPFSWPPAVTIDCAKKALHISWVWRWGISALQVTIPETPKWSLYELTPSLLVTTGSDHRLCQKALHILRVSTPCSVDSKLAKFQSLATCPMIRRSRSDLESMAPIISRFRISQFRHSYCKVFRHSNFCYPKPRNGVGSTVHIKPWSDDLDHFVISTFLWYFFLTLQVVIRETPKWCKPVDFTRGLTCVEYLPRVTLIRDLHVPKMSNHFDTCHCLVVPCVLSWRGLLTCLFRDLEFCNFGTHVVKNLDISISRYPKSQ